MSWLSSFFRKAIVKKILEFGAKLLKIVVGKVADDVMRIAKQEVDAAEATGLGGLEKYQLAFNGLQKRFPAIKESVLNHSIETAVLALQAAKE